MIRVEKPASPHAACQYNVMSPTPESSVDTGAELSEIDARLLALQEYMRDLDTGH